ncbi:hypothetical protein LX77_00933 [Gelidibacter algens]|uniref:Uncharacterized protein n=1 Tax=Gelidibacter algens TaxID=49280 RepID=A0A1A7R4V1_9FLAO|nr:hypothetical protein [Gelidibacter algens]OBX26499.1 hypothetical protein A9996_04175 [Gelidibacter algens]RAJ26678.1 hypothetical protein LX77_00933 [Gelidibacter algens]
MASQNYFSLYREAAGPSIFKSDSEGDTTGTGPKAIFQWLALFLGVLIQPFYAFYKEARNLGSLGEVYQDYYFVLFAIIVSVVAFPSVYRNSFDVNRPKWMQLIPVFTAGLGWQTIVDTAVEIASSSPQKVESVTAVLNFINSILV